MIEKLNIDDLFFTEEDYEKERLEFIASYKIFVPGFLWGHEEYAPKVAEAKWRAAYPKGFISWRASHPNVNYEDLKVMENKINEIIDKLK